MSFSSEIRDTFFEECAEQLAELESGLLAIERGEGDADTVNAVFRAVHSVKGGAGAFELTELVRFAHVFETVLDQVRSGTVEPDPALVKLLLRSSDCLSDLVGQARDGEEVESPQALALAAELNAVHGASVPDAGGGEASHAAGDSNAGDEDEIDFEPVPISMEDIFASDDAEQSFAITLTPHASLYANANETTRLLREIASLGEMTVETDWSALPDLESMDPEGAYLTLHITLRTEKGLDAVQEVFEFVDGDCDLEVMPATGSDESEEGDVDDAFAALMAQITGGDAADDASGPADGNDGEDDGPGVDVPAGDPVAEMAVAATQATPAPAEPVPAEAGAEKKPAKSAGKAGGGAPAKPTIRIDLSRVDHLIDLVGELVIQQVMLAQRVQEAGVSEHSEVAAGLEELDQLTRSMQDCVMSIRAQPVRSVFQKLPRLVREVADATGKQVHLTTEGEDTEVDKTVIERLSDPLTHMIRNAIDHGLESPEKRLAAGKPESGSVRVAAMHRSGRIVIEISDDGAGINREVVHALAVEKGLVAPDAVLDNAEIDNLIFMPGFSTQKEVSELSGRGVGMDVVRQSIQALGGRIVVDSRPGEGSIFTLSLPLTLAVLDGMLVSCGDQTLVIPLTAIVETMRPSSAGIKAYGNGQHVVRVRDTFIPVCDVGCRLGYRSKPLGPEEGVFILIEAERGGQVALRLDEIQGQRQVVIKSLEVNYGRVAGVAAATILGDGRVALILDPDGLVETAARVQSAAA